MISSGGSNTAHFGDNLQRNRINRYRLWLCNVSYGTLAVDNVLALRRRLDSGNSALWRSMGSSSECCRPSPPGRTVYPPQRASSPPAVHNALMKSRWLIYLWASPNTAVGIPLLVATLISGGKAHCVDGVLEVHGPAARFFLYRIVGITLR